MVHALVRSGGGPRSEERRENTGHACMGYVHACMRACHRCAWGACHTQGMHTRPLIRSHQVVPVVQLVGRELCKPRRCLAWRYQLRAAACKQACAPQQQGAPAAAAAATCAAGARVTCRSMRLLSLVLLQAYGVPTWPYTRRRRCCRLPVQHCAELTPAQRGVLRLQGSPSAAARRGHAACVHVSPLVSAALRVCVLQLDELPTTCLAPASSGAMMMMLCGMAEFVWSGTALSAFAAVAIAVLKCCVHQPSLLLFLLVC